MEWSKLTHLNEIVSLDTELNTEAYSFDSNLKEDLDHNITIDELPTIFCDSLEYLLQRVDSSLKYFNLLAVIKDPSSEKVNLNTEFSFMGYDLIEIGRGQSALTNNSGFDKTFLPIDINKFGLITDYEKAKRIQFELPINYPDRWNTECYLYELWRHKIIGR